MVEIINPRHLRSLSVLIAFCMLATCWDFTGAAIGQEKSTTPPTREVPPTRTKFIYSFAPIVEKTLPAVVNIHAKKIVRTKSPVGALDGSAFWRLFRDTLLFGYGKERFVNSLGSGVIVTPDGLIITNHHVIQSAQGILISLADGRTFAGQVILSDKRTDIAILRIAPQDKPLPFIKFGNSNRLKIGDLVLAIGNPFGIGQTVTSGIVSARSRAIVGVSDIRFFIQTDAAINPGNSGGALISMDGKLVGINTAIYSRSGGSQGLGFAVPIDMIRPVFESAIKNRPYLRPWIGLAGRQFPPILAAAIGISQKGVMYIFSIFPGGPAASAGLKVGDIVLTLDGFPITGFQSLQYRIATHLAGDSIDLLILRRGMKLNLKVTLTPPPDKPARNDTWLPNLNPLSGAKTASLSPALAMEYGLESTRGGVIVLDVRRGSSAANIGLRQGDIIRAYNDRPIRIVDDIMDLKFPQFKGWKMLITRAGNDLYIGRR